MNESINRLIISKIEANTIRVDINLECAMSTPSNVRRRDDGSIDIDHYRRAAMRQRAAARRHMSRRLAAAISRIVGALSAMAPGRLPAPQPAAR